jgi:hypothetical protein
MRMTFDSCNLYVSVSDKTKNFCHGSTALVSLGLLIAEVSKSRSDILQAVGLLWTSNRPVAETST